MWSEYSTTISHFGSHTVGCMSLGNLVNVHGLHRKIMKMNTAAQTYTPHCNRSCHSSCPTMLCISDLSNLCGYSVVSRSVFVVCPPQSMKKFTLTVNVLLRMSDLVILLCSKRFTLCSSSKPSGFISLFLQLVCLNHLCIVRF